MAKTYQLMAWTDKGQVKMIPSLVAELAEPYVQRIQAIKQVPHSRDENAETRQLIRLSRAHEAFARFFLRVGYWEDAFLQYTEAALVVLPQPPLERRFLSMFNHCLQLADEHPAIKDSVQWDELHREWEHVCLEATPARRAS